MKTSGVSCETKFGLLGFLGHPTSMVAYMQGGMKCRHMISRDRDDYEGWGSTAVWNLSQNLSDLVA